MKRTIQSVLLIAIFFALIAFQFSCKAEDIVQVPATTKQLQKKYFYLEEISISGDTTRTPIVVTN